MNDPNAVIGTVSAPDLTVPQNPNEYINQLRTENAALRARVQALEEALKEARIKLIINRKHGTGEYHGGMEYERLISLINAALPLAQEVS